MKKISVQCRYENIICLCGQEKTTRIYRSVSDFYEGFDLFICPHCKALFALDRETFKYSRKILKEVLQDKTCSACTNPLTDLLSYPKHYVCSYCKDLQTTDGIEGHTVNKQTEVVKFYDLLS